jgi:exopolysaccharide biosynthesis polyprenyl glycosylphosphotransferase
MNRKVLPLIYIVTDIVVIVTAVYWLSGKEESLVNSDLVLFPGAVVFYTFLSLLAGFYTAEIRRSRLSEFFRSVTVAVILSFTLAIIGGIQSESAISEIISAAVSVIFPRLFILTWIPRLIISSYVAGRVHSGKWGTSTAIIGSGEKAADILTKIQSEKVPSGNIITGFISTGEEDLLSCRGIKMLGNLDNLGNVIESNGIEEVIIASESNGHDTVAELAGRLEYLKVTIKIIPSLRDLLTGRIELTSIYGTLLLEIPVSPMPVWQQILKSIADRILAVLLLALLTPIIIGISLAIKLLDNGPVFFRQERIGRNGKPFRLIKFRSMPVDAEKNGPMLSGSHDTRVTPAGKFLRRHRLDEIPNLINVIAGDMSLVGPRPERSFFIEQIVKTAPQYRRLHRIKPGITSWGQVKYGYASSVEEMIERMEFDLLYLDNMSLLVDLRILFYTFVIILRGKGV